MKQSRHRRLATGALVGAVLLGSVALAEDVWIKSDNVSIRSGKGAIYPEIAGAKKGTKLNVIAHEGKWLKVNVGDKDGYVFQDAVSNEEVGSGGNVLAGLGAGAGSTDMSSGAAGKGLSESANKYAAGKHLSPAAMDDLIKKNKQIDPKEWEAFTAEGKVGPNVP